MKYIKVPMDIEKRSFEIITEELGEKNKLFTEEQAPVIKRLVHTTADFEYADITEFSEGVIEKAMEAIKGGSKIYCDTSMIVNGLSKKNLERFGCVPYSMVSDPEVARVAKERGVTRSMVGMEKAAKDPETKIYLIGNAPTALFTLKELVEKGEAEKPALVIGVPVGFVGAAESKEALKEMKDIPYIITRGRKGGSTVAVAALHGILYQMYDRKDF
ncbi:precorrin-8X methylmutase [uncultured Ilyobacter sp.]|uniref:precorrin-8X methylmutase n=1 Tax=uncultured Ilyobacter sp. TaxID=544433 RepID=UPI0029F55431|nr:precorrin-8X methylmutase [uncultured Ilyobacter sp.]